MPSLWPFSKESKQDITATIPLVTDLSGVSYPTDNYSNFASNGYGKNEIVHACIRELATSAASPRYFVESTDRASGIVEDRNSPFAKLIARPNPKQDLYSWLECFITYLQVAGNVYVLKERNRTNTIIALWLLRPDRVAVIPSDMGVNSYLYTIDGKEYHIPSEDISHLSLPNPSGDVYGLAPLSVAAKVINLDLAMTDFAKVFFQNAGVPSGLLKIKKRINSQEEASTIRARWRSTFGGSGNMHRVAILDDDATYQPMAAAPKDMDLKGLHDLTESRICAVFGVPPILIGANVGLQHATYANYREARMSFHTETVEPLVNRVVRFMNFSLMPEFSNQLQLSVDYTNILSFLDDRDSQSTRISNLFQAGIVTLNEARELVGQDRVTGGDVRQVGMQTFEIGTFVEGQETIEQSLPVATEEKQLLPLRPIIKAQKPSRRAMQLSGELVTARLPEEDKLTAQMTRHYNRLRDRVNGITGRLMERSEASGTPIDPGIELELLITPEAEQELVQLLRNSYIRISKEAFIIIAASGLAGDIAAWSNKDPVVTGMLSQANTRAAMIHHTPNKHIKKSVDEAISRGYSIEQLARGVPADNFPGIRSVMADGIDWKAKRVARTETMRTQNMVSTDLYSKQGIDYSLAYDPDGGKGDNYVDPSDPYGRTCAQRSGNVYRNEDARMISDHPNGTLSWTPLVDYVPPAGGL
jgi:HK97 family phage portal protein